MLHRSWSTSLPQQCQPRTWDSWEAVARAEVPAAMGKPRRHLNLTESLKMLCTDDIIIIMKHFFTAQFPEKKGLKVLHNLHTHTHAHTHTHTPILTKRTGGRGEHISSDKHQIHVQWWEQHWQNITKHNSTPMKIIPKYEMSLRRLWFSFLFINLSH